MEKVFDELDRKIEEFDQQFRLLQAEIKKVIVGHEEIIDGLLTALLTDGNVLLEGPPGLGKTKLVQTLSEALHLKFSRIQFTPDLMPADIVGTNVVQETHSGERVFEFQVGPIFSNIVLADEINRATPKTQSALLEAMQEKSVTVGKRTYQLESPFFVLATQNPIEMEGTYPLPEAQLDRFLLKLKMDYPDVESLHLILDRTTQPESPRVSPVLDVPQIMSMRNTVRSVPISRPIQDYAIRIVLATHPHSSQAHPLTERYVRYGSSPRGAQALVMGGKVLALLNNRVHVSCEDIRAIVPQALRHRLLLNFEGEAEHIDPDSILKEIVREAHEP